jgi:hypothetical protein
MFFASVGGGELDMMQEERKKTWKDLHEPLKFRQGSQITGNKK